LAAARPRLLHLGDLIAFVDLIDFIQFVTRPRASRRPLFEFVVISRGTVASRAIIVVLVLFFLFDATTTLLASPRSSRAIRAEVIGVREAKDREENGAEESQTQTKPSFLAEVLRQIDHHHDGDNQADNRDEEEEEPPPLLAGVRSKTM